MKRIRKISVAVLSWNGQKHLELCLPALLAQQTPGWDQEILVLDNGSQDGTADWLKHHYPQVRLIESSVNLGFCAGNNRLAKEATGEALVFLNNDTRPREGWLHALGDALASAAEDVAAISGKIIDWSGERLDFARGLLTFDGHAFQKGFGQPLETAEEPTDGDELLFACGGNMIVWRDVFLQVGGFDESYFAYLEDVDLGWRLWSAGWRVLYAQQAVVHHRSMATSQNLGNHHRGFLFERNAFLTAYKNYDQEFWEKMMPAVLLTLSHRTQALLVQNNPGGEILTLDPYAGHIANTSGNSPAGAGDFPSVAAAGAPRLGLVEKWREYGPGEFFKRGVRKALQISLPGWVFEQEPYHPRLTDGRTVAQFRALTNLWGNLDRAALSRQENQKRRQRADREIFERFSLYLVPTYPGDEEFFNSPAFNTWLPQDIPVVRCGLGDVMNLRD